MYSIFNGGRTQKFPTAKGGVEIRHHQVIYSDDEDVIAEISKFPYIAVEKLDDDANYVEKLDDDANYEEMSFADLRKAAKRRGIKLKRGETKESLLGNLTEETETAPTGENKP